MAGERRQRIARLVEERGSVTVAELSEVFHISEVSLRADLAELARTGFVVRTHGGALAPDGTRFELDFATRERIHVEEKTRIGEAAAALIEDGDTFVLDASTTALQIARRLGVKKDITAITNGVWTALEFAARRGASVILTGGMVRESTGSLVGSWTEELLGRLHARYAFLSCKAINSEQGMMDSNLLEAQMKLAMARCAEQVVGLADASKLGRYSLATSVPMERISKLITDRTAPADTVVRFRELGLEVMTV